MYTSVWVSFTNICKKTPFFSQQIALFRKKDFLFGPRYTKIEDYIATQLDKRLGDIFFYLYFVCWYSQIYHVLLDGGQVLSWQRKLWVPRAPGICDFLTAATGAPPHGLVVINQTK